MGKWTNNGIILTYPGTKVLVIFISIYFLVFDFLWVGEDDFSWACNGVSDNSSILPDVWVQGLELFLLCILLVFVIIPVDGNKPVDAWL